MNRVALFLLAFFALFAPVTAYAAKCVPGAPCVESYRLNAQIDADSVLASIRRIKQAELDHATAFVLEINTPGGSVTDGFELAKAIENSQVPVYCVVDGMAASMGAYILQSCPYRVITSRSTLMFHEPSLGGLMSGNPNAWRSVADELAALHRAMSWHCVHRMTVSYKYYRRHTDGGKQWWLDWEEAVAVGAVDAVVETPAQLVAMLKS